MPYYSRIGGLKNVNAEKFLCQYQDSKARLRRLEEERQGIRDLVTHITPGYGSVSVRHDPNLQKIPDAIIRLEELDKKYSEESRRAVDLMGQIHDAIYTIPDEKARDILILYYIMGKTHKEIVYDLQISSGTERQRFKQGMEQIQAVVSSDLNQIDIV